MNLDNLLDLDTMLKGLGTTGRVLAASAFGSAKTDPKILDRIARAMYATKGGDWDKAEPPDRLIWVDRAVAALSVIQEIVRGK